LATDWHGYNEDLIRRGEIHLDLGLLKSWGEELEEMNGGREGGRYLYPDSLIRLQAVIRACFRLPYRQLEGFSRALSRWEPRLVTPDYSTTCRRVNTLDIGLQSHSTPMSR
jgi:hypothetical protein